MLDVPLKGWACTFTEDRGQGSAAAAALTKHKQGVLQLQRRATTAVGENSALLALLLASIYMYLLAVRAVPYYSSMRS